MLVSEWQSGAIAWGVGGGVAVAAAVGALWMLRREVRIGAVAFALLALAGLAFSISKFGNGTRVLLVEQAADGALHRIDLRLYGTAAYVYRNGSAQTLEWLRARQLVINNTPVPLTLQTVRYGHGLSTSAQIRPFDSHAADGPVEFFGRSAQPPAVSSGGDAVKYWIYW